MSLINKMSNPLFLKIVGTLAFALALLLIGPDLSFAATSTSTVQSKLKSGTTAIQTVLTGVVVVIGIIACLKIIIKHAPNLDDPHTKNEMWKSLGGVAVAMAAGAAVVWLMPWFYGLFK